MWQYLAVLKLGQNLEISRQKILIQYLKGIFNEIFFQGLGNFEILSKFQNFPILSYCILQGVSRYLMAI